MAKYDKRKEGLAKKVYRVGFVGYCPPSKYDEKQAELYIKDAFDKIEKEHPDEQIELVSGATNVGTLKQAYEEAHKRGWRLIGIASKKAKDYPLNPHLIKKILVGDNWGEESPKFLEYIRHGAMVKVGGDKQSKREADAMIRMGNEVLEYELPLQTEDAPKKGIEKIVGAVALIFIILGVLLFVPVITGNAITIGEISKVKLEFIGIIDLLIGGVLGWYYFRKRG